MLPIILGIIKLIGIILGILLLLLLAALLAVFFVPVRYQIQARKKEEEICAGINISWLLHIVSASLRINKRAEREIVVRLFGIRLPLFGNKKKKRRVKKPETPIKMKEPETVEDVPEQEDIPETEDVPETENVLTEEDVLTEADILEEADVPEGDASGEKSDVPVNGCEPENADTPDETPDTDNAQKTKGSGKIRFSFHGICDRIKTVSGDLLKKAEALTGKICGLARIPGRLLELAKKPGQLLELAKKLEAEEVLRDVFGYLIYLLRHYAPRRISGFLRFGTGDPAVTGQLTGLIYLILPARADRFAVQPEFGDAVFETEISCKGYIRAVHLIRVIWWGFRNRKLRRIIRYRNRG